MAAASKTPASKAAPKLHTRIMNRILGKAAPQAAQKDVKKEAKKETKKASPPKAASKGARPAKPVIPPKAPALKVKGKAPAEKTAKPGKAAEMPAPPVAAKGKQGRSKSAASREGVVICREIACELASTTGGYCRMHYIKNWKKIKRKELILKERKLNRYIEELVSKYPDKYIDAIRQDLSSEKEFAKVISDLEIEEGLDDFEGESDAAAEGIIDNIKREVEDDGDIF